jgi:hypothetical protein
MDECLGRFSVIVRFRGGARSRSLRLRRGQAEPGRVLCAGEQSSHVLGRTSWRNSCTNASLEETLADALSNLQVSSHVHKLAGQLNGSRCIFPIAVGAD